MIGDTSRAGWADRPVGMTVLVTGASGTLGSVVLPRLAKDGYEVRPMSRAPARPGWTPARSAPDLAAAAARRDVPGDPGRWADHGRDTCGHPRVAGLPGRQVLSEDGGRDGKPEARTRPVPPRPAGHAGGQGARGVARRRAGRRRPSAGRADRSGSGRHRGVLRGVRRGAGRVGELCDRGGPPRRGDPVRGLHRPGHHPRRRQRRGPPAPGRAQVQLRADGRRGPADRDGVRRHHRRSACPRTGRSWSTPGWRRRRT